MRITRTRVVLAALLLSALALVGWRKYETHELENRLAAIAGEIARWKAVRDRAGIEQEQ